MQDKPPKTALESGGLEGRAPWKCRNRQLTACPGIGSGCRVLSGCRNGGSKGDSWLGQGGRGTWSGRCSGPFPAPGEPRPPRTEPFPQAATLASPQSTALHPQPPSPFPGPQEVGVQSPHRGSFCGRLSSPPHPDGSPPARGPSSKLEGIAVAPPLSPPLIFLPVNPALETLFKIDGAREG